MEIIKNASTLLNEIKNNSFLTINDNGEIVKQSTFKGILRKISDFFKNNLGGGEAVTQRQKKLDSAMTQMLAQSNLSEESFENIKNSVYAAFNNSELTSTVSKLKLMAQVGKIDPELRGFVKGVIADMDKQRSEMKDDVYFKILNNVIHTMSKRFKDVDPNNPEIKKLHEAITKELNETAMEAVNKNDNEDFSSMFELDLDRNNFSVNGKESSVGAKDPEGIKNELMSLFPNRTTRVFISELLSQTVGNVASIPLRAGREQDDPVNALKVKIPDSFVGDLTLPGFNLDDEDQEINPDKPVYNFKGQDVQKESAGYTLEVQKDNEGKIIGATIINERTYLLSDDDIAPGLDFGKFYYSLKIDVDLTNPDEPKVVNSSLSYGGEQKGFTFETEEKLNAKR